MTRPCFPKSKSRIRVLVEAMYVHDERKPDTPKHLPSHEKIPMRLCLHKLKVGSGGCTYVHIVLDGN